MLGWDRLTEEEPEVVLQLPLCLINAPCNDTSIHEERTEAIQGKGVKVCVQGVAPDPHEEHIQTTCGREYF